MKPKPNPSADDDSWSLLLLPPRPAVASPAVTPAAKLAIRGVAMSAGARPTDRGDILDSYFEQYAKATSEFYSTESKAESSSSRKINDAQSSSDKFIHEAFRKYTSSMKMADASSTKDITAHPEHTKEALHAWEGKAEAAASQRLSSSQKASDSFRTSLEDANSAYSTSLQEATSAFERSTGHALTSLGLHTPPMPSSFTIAVNPTATHEAYSSCETTVTASNALEVLTPALYQPTSTAYIFAGKTYTYSVLVNLGATASEDAVHSSQSMVPSRTSSAAFGAYTMVHGDILPACQHMMATNQTFHHLMGLLVLDRKAQAAQNGEMNVDFPIRPIKQRDDPLLHSCEVNAATNATFAALMQPTKMEKVIEAAVKTFEEYIRQGPVSVKSLVAPPMLTPSEKASHLSKSSMAPVKLTSMKKDKLPDCNNMTNTGELYNAQVEYAAWYALLHSDDQDMYLLERLSQCEYRFRQDEIEKAFRPLLCYDRKGNVSYDRTGVWETEAAMAHLENVRRRIIDIIDSFVVNGTGPVIGEMTTTVHSPASQRATTVTVSTTALATSVLDMPFQTTLKPTSRRRVTKTKAATADATIWPFSTTVAITPRGEPSRTPSPDDWRGCDPSSVRLWNESMYEVAVKRVVWRTIDKERKRLNKDSNQLHGAVDAALDESDFQHHKIHAKLDMANWKGLRCLANAVHSYDSWAKQHKRKWPSTENWMRRDIEDAALKMLPKVLDDLRVPMTSINNKDQKKLNETLHKQASKVELVDGINPKTRILDRFAIAKRDELTLAPASNGESTGTPRSDDWRQCRSEKDPRGQFVEALEAQMIWRAEQKALTRFVENNEKSRPDIAHMAKVWMKAGEAVAKEFEPKIDRKLKKCIKKARKDYNYWAKKHQQPSTDKIEEQRLEELARESLTRYLFANGLTDSNSSAGNQVIAMDLNRPSGVRKRAAATVAPAS